MRTLNLDAAGRRIIVLSPLDGSQDFYVSCMLGIPASRVRTERDRLLHALTAAQRGEAWQ